MLHKILIVFLLSLSILPIENAKAEESQFLRSHIEQVINQSDYTIEGELLSSHELLLSIYSKNQFQLLWHRPDSVQQLFKAISSSALEGLTPNDYHLQPLLRMQKQKNAGTHAPPLSVNYDLLLTSAFIRLAYDKSFGKVDPQHLYSTSDSSENSIQRDLSTIIEESIRNGNIGEALASLSSHSVFYTHLKTALARYKSIQQNGGWSSISAGPTLRPDAQGPRILALRDRLFHSGDLAVENLQSPLFDEDLRQAVRRFQRRHSLDVDGVVGRQTLKRLNTSVKQRINQIRVNLERARWISHDLPATFILVDIADFTLYYYMNNQVIWTTKVIVGLPYHTTPSFESSIKYLVINPTWTIPRSIIRRETIPHIQQNGDYLQEQNLHILDYQGKPIDAASIDWHSYSGHSFPYLIRQTSGSYNALGRIKFILPNKYSIYLHDTPHRELFSKDHRAFSHGCIRVDNPLTLGELILKNDGQNWDRYRFEKVIAGGKTTNVSLKKSLPVMLIYRTVNADDSNNILFMQDIYNRDTKLLKALNAPHREEAAGWTDTGETYQKRTRPVSR